jgi:hypothetical protein
MSELDHLLPYIDQSASLVFAILVWIELRAMRKQSLDLLIRIDERLSK